MLSNGNLLHFGAGALGLGLVSNYASKAGLKVIVSNRSDGQSKVRNEKLQKDKKFCIHDLRGNLVNEVNLETLIWSDKDPDEISNYLKDPETLFLTTSLRLNSAIEAIAEPVKNGLLARDGTSPPICIMACENDIETRFFREAIIKGSPQAEIDKIDSVSIFSQCSVDKICRGPHTDESTGNIIVYAEEFTEWIIEVPSGKTIDKHKSILESLPGVQFVNNVEPYKQRKLQLLNGPHYLIAIHALSFDNLSLDHYLTTTEGKTVLGEILKEALDCFTVNSTAAFSNVDLNTYTKAVSQRFKAAPDTVTRILKRFKPKTLELFFSSLHLKSTASALQYCIQKNSAPHITSKTTYMIAELIKEQKYPSEPENS